MNNDLKVKYFNTLGIRKIDSVAIENPTKITTAHEKALNRAYTLRSFEIEHYWKRATYFWGFQIAIFTALGWLWKTEANTTISIITVALAILGVMTAFASYFSAEGSKFWQENWEYHIDMLEDDIEGRLYKTVWLDNGKRGFSVSSINQTLNMFITIFWCLVALYVSYEFAKTSILNFLKNILTCTNKDFVIPCKWFNSILIELKWFNFEWFIIICILIVTIFGISRLYRQKSGFDGTYPNKNGEHGENIKKANKKMKSKNFMRRYAPHEEP